MGELRKRGSAAQNADADDRPEGDSLLHYKAEPRRGLVRRFLDHLFLFAMVHYLFWFWPMAAVPALLYYFGYWWLALAAVVWYLTNFFDMSHVRGGRPWDGFRRHRAWKATHKYLSLEMIRTQKLDPSRQYIFGYHPHGIIILSRIASYGGKFEEFFPGITHRVLGATPMFWMPGARELSLWMGAVDASRASAERCIRKGHSLTVYPGGSKEIFTTDAESKVNKLTLKSRKGFVKLAMRFGCDLVPVFVFGEKWLYSRVQIPTFIRNWFLRVTRVPLILFWGKWGTLMPFKKRLGVVYGAPIRVDKVENPTEEQLDSLHAQYTEAVCALFHAHKRHFGYDDDETLVVE